MTLRPAAVLVLLTDGPDLPHVLLTCRAPDLTRYPAQFAFPGGAAEPEDRDALETALREAREEIGLDPASVHVIGTLPSLGLRDSGFLVTPVLAWSRQPRYLHPANPEVTMIRVVPLAASRSGQPPQLAMEADSGAGTVGTGAVPVGVMTSTIFELLAAYLAAATPATNNTAQA